jgi:hypothetical protein
VEGDRGNEAELESSIRTVLLESGPVAVEQLVDLLGDTGHEVDHIRSFLDCHSDEFASDPHRRYWFMDRPWPVPRFISGWARALVVALGVFPGGASIDDVLSVLCLSTVSGCGRPTRHSVATELSQRPLLFERVARGSYRLLVPAGAEASSGSGDRDETGGEEEAFDPYSFYDQWPVFFGW